MKLATFRRLAIVCILCALHSPSGRAQTTNKQKNPSGSVAGNVKIKDKAAGGIVVSMRSSNPAGPFDQSFRGKTDDEGNYTIRNVPAGTYDVAPLASAYVFVGPNNSRTKQVVLGDGEIVGDINFSLVRGGVITGKVSDADGRPVIQERVALYRTDLFLQSQPGQERHLYPNGTVMTDDRGTYRFFGLTAGKYKVAVGVGTDAFAMSLAQGRPTYSQVFHPNVSDDANATVIEVSEGSEANNVDITVGRAQQTFAASGLTVDDKGLPIPNVRFGVQRIAGDRPQLLNSLAISNNRGLFTLEGLIPGKYEAFLMPAANSELRVESLTFEVIDQDVTGLLLKLSSGASISGVVVLDTENKNALARLARLQVSAYVPSQTGGGMGRSGSGSINPDGSFRVAGLPPGTASLGLGGTPDPRQAIGFAISRIERDGVLHPRGLEVREGEQITGVRVVLVYGTGILHGTVKVENGQLPTGANVMVRLTKVGDQNPLYLRQPRVDSRNRFITENLSPGVYEVSASVYVPNSRIRATTRQQVTVADEVTTEVVLTLDLGSANPQ